MKLGRTSEASVAQFKSYMTELVAECVTGILIAESPPKMKERNPLLQI